MGKSREAFTSTIRYYAAKFDLNILVETGTNYGDMVEAIKRELALDPNVVFYLATGSPEEEISLGEVFPGKIVRHKKASYDRNDPKAIRDALIDLYCLANCRKLIGSYYSSFTETASEISGIDKQVIDARECI